jgi:endo-1,4-beta-xylanase
LKQDTVLYSGPGNEGYEVLAQLKAGMVVYPLGVYTDFVKVEVETGEKKEGYVWKEALRVIPQGLKQLDAKDVPWQTVFIQNSFISSQTAFKGNEIILQNGSASPYDVDGTTPISIDTPFMLTLRLQVNGAMFGSIKIYGIYKSPDKLWWQDIRRMDIAWSRGSIQLGFRDGTSENFKSTINLPVSSSQPFSVVFSDLQGKVLTILDQDQRDVKTIDVTGIPGLQMKDGLLPDRKLWLGISSAPHSTLTVSSPTLRKVPVGTMVAEKEPGLRRLAAQRGIKIGTEFSIYRMRDARYWNIMANDFTTAILSGFSDRNFWRGRKDYDWGPLDRTVDFALQQGWRVYASHLVWGTSASGEYDAIPDWLRKSNFSREEYIQILEEHVKAVVGHFKGRVAEWSAVNEVTQRSFCGKGGCDFWADKIGPDYVEMVFRWAKEADPNANLMFNETNNHSLRDPASARTAAKMLETVRTLKAKGVPIDSVGMHMHYFLGYKEQVPKKEEVLEVMNALGALGVDVHITELDVNLQDVSGSQQERWDFEAKIYRDMMEACIESKVCKGFSTWGVSDSTSWYTIGCNGCPNFPNSDPLMFDKNYKPKPAYFAIRDALMGKPMATPTPKP